MSVEETSPLLRVHCGQDGGIVDCVRTAKMRCKNGHELAKDFPYDSFWDYCCDCDIFCSSTIVSEKGARSNCPFCNRLIARRYLCHRCRMMSFESDENKQAKQINLGAGGSPLPHCPGCLESAVSFSIQQHDCSNLSLTYMTAREVCPFCNEWITEARAIDANVEDSIPAIDIDRSPNNFPFLESFSHRNIRFSFLRSYLPDSRKGWFEFISIASAIITTAGLLLTIFPSVPAAIGWQISKAIKAPLRVSQIDCTAHFVLKGERLRLKIRADAPATGLRFEWASSAGTLVNHHERNSESEVELETDAISVMSVPVEVLIRVTVADEYGDTASRQERITVMPRRITNNPPVFKIPPRCNCLLQEVIAGESVSLYALAEDEDSDEDLTYDWQSSSPSIQIIKTASDGGSTVILTTSGVNPKLTAVPIKVSLIVNDGNGGAVTGDLTLMILPKQVVKSPEPVAVTPPPANHSPKLEAFVADKTIVQAGETITLWAYVTDQDGDDLIYDRRTSAGEIQNKHETAILNTAGITSSKVIVILTILDPRGGKTSQQMPIDVKLAAAPAISPSPSPTASEVKDHQ